MKGQPLPMAPQAPDRPLPLLRALADETRLEIVLLLGARGELDVEAIAEGFAQDRSVISRHLAALHAAGVLIRRADGRRALYRLDGAALLARLEALTALVRASLAGCCPPDEDDEAGQDRLSP